VRGVQRVLASGHRTQPDVLGEHVEPLRLVGVLGLLDVESWFSSASDQRVDLRR
jgi:hypothetical protein